MIKPLSPCPYCCGNMGWWVLSNGDRYLPVDSHTLSIALNASWVMCITCNGTGVVKEEEPMSNPEWRTPTIIAICHTIRDEKTYEDAPILADALDDSGYTDENILYFLRNRDGNHIELMREICLILGGEYEEAVKWLEGFIEELNLQLCDGDEEGYAPGRESRVNYYQLMKALQTGSGIHFGVDTPDICYEKANEMWERYQIVMADSDPRSVSSWVFSCSC